MTTHSKHARFRFYAELNDFLPTAKRQAPFDYAFSGTPSIKDAIEAIGIPHPEVDLVVVNGRSVGWGYHLAPEDDVSVYPVFEAVDISPAVRLRSEPLRVTRFMVDTHLGRLARWVRMLGFDAICDAGFDHDQIVEVSLREHRIILTHNRQLLKDARVTHGYWVRATEPREQIEEVVVRLDLRSQFTPFSRCMDCNGTITARPLEDVAHRVPPMVRKQTGSFHQCEACGKVYWNGTHVQRMRTLIDALRGPGG